MRSRRLREILVSIGVNVRERRIARGLTQEVLAETANIEARFLQEVEHARANLSIDVLVALADALGAEPHELLADRRDDELAKPSPGRPRKLRKKPVDQ
jgi:transcriptional regulator with XRE-family HTH domain